MRKLPLVFLLLQVALPAFAAKRITVAQLERLVAENHAKSDAKIAPRFYDLELTERLSAAKLAALETALPGPESRRSLVALADQAAFLDPPPPEIPAATPPDPDTQRRMMAAAVDYATKTMHQLPNLFATRDTIHFEDSPAVQKDLGEENVSGTFTPYQPLHPVSRSSVAVLYRDGQEVVDAANRVPSSSSSLTSKGEFGPILATVLGDAPQGNLIWSHWEQGPTSLLAVFRFVVPRSNSHYQVEFCCIDNSTFRRFSGYHGELTLDPAAGTILRLTLMADLAKADPVVKADIMVEYGPVELGSRTYICPVKSVSIFLAPEQLPGVTRVTGRAGGIAQRPTDVVHQDLHSAPLQTMLNEVVFDDYHLFRADARILADNAIPAANQPAGQPTPSASPIPVPPQQTLTQENHPPPHPRRPLPPFPLPPRSHRQPRHRPLRPRFRKSALQRRAACRMFLRLPRPRPQDRTSPCGSAPAWSMSASRPMTRVAIPSPASSRKTSKSTTTDESKQFAFSARPLHRPAFPPTLLDRPPSHSTNRFIRIAPARWKARTPHELQLQQAAPPFFSSTPEVWPSPISPSLAGSC